MKRLMSIAAIALFVSGTMVYAGSGCGCPKKTADGKKAPACSGCKPGQACACGKAAANACPNCKPGQPCAACAKAKADAKAKAASKK